MLFSVVIPTRNRLELLRDALRGLAAQTLPASEFEVVVVDNGSTDGTFESLSAESEDYPYALNVIKNPDCERGPAPARNLGVREAKGQIIAFLDSDCRPDVDWLSAAADVFTQYAALSMAKKPRCNWWASAASLKATGRRAMSKWRWLRAVQ